MPQPTLDATTGQVIDDQPANQQTDQPILPAKLVNALTFVTVGFLVGYAYCWYDSNKKSISE
jgi:hypothetical protein